MHLSKLNCLENKFCSWIFSEFCDGEMSPAKTGSLFSPTFRFPENGSSNGGSRPVTPSRSQNGTQSASQTPEDSSSRQQRHGQQQCNHSDDVFMSTSHSTAVPLLLDSLTVIC